MPVLKLAVNDLIAQFRTGSPPFLLWLGAGASASSRIPTASVIVTDRLRTLLSLDESAGAARVRKIARKRLDWFRGDAGSEYARVMEKSFTNPVLRQDYLLQLIRRARLSRGYIHLGALIEAGVFNTVLTPNFDYLAPQGFYRVSTTPLIEINEPSQFRWLSPAPHGVRLLVRLHGDFTHDNLANTRAETAHEDTRDRLRAVRSRLAASHGLIVIGYAGADRNIQEEFFNPSLWEEGDTFPAGVFWCKRRGDRLPRPVSKFLESAPRGRAAVVEIQGFDETMQAIAQHVVGESSDRVLAPELPHLWEQVALLLDLADRFFSGADRQSTLNEIDVAAQRAAGILKAGRWVVALSQPRKAGLYVVSSGGSLPKGRRFPKTMRGSFGQYQLPADVTDCYVRRNSKEIGFIRFGSDEPFPVKDQDKFVRAAGKAMAGLLALRG